MRGRLASGHLFVSGNHVSLLLDHSLVLNNDAMCKLHIISKRFQGVVVFQLHPEMISEFRAK